MVLFGAILSVLPYPRPFGVSFFSGLGAVTSFGAGFSPRFFLFVFILHFIFTGG